MPTHLGSSSQLQDAVARYWGYTSFRPLQREAMDAVMAGRDSIVVLPTGGGKSLCFQAPAVVHDGLAIVVSPLISLMKDQVDTLVGNGVPAGLYNSSLAPDEKAAVVAGLRQGRYRLLYVSPERLVGEGGDGFLSLLSSCPMSPISFVAIDEAHCISQWGHDFRPEYRQLGRLRQQLPGVSLHAYTATATVRVRRDIASQLALKNPIEFVGSFDRPNLVYRVVPRATLKRQLLDLLDRHRREAGIIYCTSRREVDALSAWLNSVPALGVRALPYHAGLSDAERSRNQDAFLSERADVIVATVAFGMGIDRSDVRFVVHAGAPRSLEHYQQESGRAGRDGLEAECLLIYSAADFMRWRVMLERSGEFTDATRTLMRGMERYATGVSCRHRQLAEYFGDRYQPVGADGCAACDYCLDELEAAASPVVLARKILSCVARVGQRFGATHVASVLRGHATDAVLARGHEKLSTFGLLPDASVTEVRGYIEQLAGYGLLQQAGDEYPVLSLTPVGVALLKDESSFPGLALARQRPPRKDKARVQSRVEAESWQDVDRSLFERLRAVRLEIARARGVPPYVIFHDATLREMARLRPTSMAALLGVKGVGTRKADDLGETFLSAIRESTG
ncbi:MAG TPA: DNA helicase RecQ [Vicinamibacterales bacterium]|nr:DNA helicase RecQ [Vicinamibacterales bacterium]